MALTFVSFFLSFFTHIFILFIASLTTTTATTKYIIDYNPFLLLFHIMYISLHKYNNKKINAYFFQQ
ncbi:hypothetical protein BDF21DRAFT_405613 [Thamnidium elegans]|nr:hypothetical protein BDF21DRAFT_405613 [Thamnidium elegans]